LSVVVALDRHSVHVLFLVATLTLLVICVNVVIRWIALSFPFGAVSLSKGAFLLLVRRHVMDIAG
jgi:hypothetical protein